MPKYSAAAPTFGRARNTWLKVASGQSYLMLTADAQAIIALERERDECKAGFEALSAPKFVVDKNGILRPLQPMQTEEAVSFVNGC